MCQKLPTICQKIDAFERHVFTRQLRIAQILAEHFVSDKEGDELSQIAFVIMSIALAYFEMIEQFASGKSSDGSSPEFFKRGFQRVYSTTPVSNDDVRRIYKYFRCGMYHIAMPRIAAISLVS